MLHTPIMQLSERSLNHENSLYNQRGLSAKGQSVSVEPCSPQPRDPVPQVHRQTQIPGRLYLKSKHSRHAAPWRFEPYQVKVLPDPDVLERLVVERKRQYMMYYAQMATLTAGAMSPMSSYSPMAHQASEQPVSFFDQPSSLPGLSASPQAFQSVSPQSPLASISSRQASFVTAAPTAEDSPTKSLNTSVTKVYHSDGRPRAFRVLVEEPELNPQDHPYVLVQIDNEDRVVAFGDVERLKIGEQVIVAIDRGVDLAKVLGEAAEPSKPTNVQEKILRLATSEDLQTQEELRYEAAEALEVIRPIALKHLGNALTVIGVHIRLDREKLTVKYHSAQRVDFRALCRSLNQIYHCRIWFLREEEEGVNASA